MKKTAYTLTILAITFFATAFGQKPVMELTFTADNNGQYVPLTSIFIENLTKGGDTTLYAPDTVLSISYQLGIEDHESNAFSLSQNFPNPFEGQTSICLYMPGRDNIRLRVYNLLGKEVASTEQTLGVGYHTFTFHCGNERMYVLTAACGSGTRTIRMMGMKGQATGQCTIEYSGMDGEMTYKSYQGKSGFKFNLGDQLQYTGNTALEQSVLTDSPTGNITYTFLFTTGAPCPGTPTVTYGGQVYNTVQIGTQCWLKENLNIGTMILGIDEQTNNGMIDKYCYEDNPANCNVFGGLYQWNEMMQYVTAPGVKGICPDGWHIPTDAEWCTLTKYIDATVDCNDIGYSGADVGTKMKSTTVWYGGGNGTNASGFTTLPGGYRSTAGDFSNLTYTATFWSSSESGSYAWYRNLDCDYASILRSFYHVKDEGFSVRCEKD